jgi:hypothetical protein
MNAQCSSQFCAVGLAGQTIAFEAWISRECPLRPELSRERIRFSAHHDGDSLWLLQWTPHFLSSSRTCAAGSWVKQWSLKPGFQPYVSCSLSLYKHSSVSQHSSVWHSRRSPQWTHPHTSSRSNFHRWFRETNKGVWSRDCERMPAMSWIFSRTNPFLSSSRWRLCTTVTVNPTLARWEVAPIQ